MSTFDPSIFEQTVLNESNDTRIAPVPEDEYLGEIKSYEFRTTNSGKTMVNVLWKTTDPKAVDATGLPEPTVRQTIWLDVTDAGGLDMGKGKNVSLGKFREAIDMNKPGFTWQNTIGKLARIKVKHDIAKDGSGEIYANVAAVTKA
jgi:hypothetical protein